MPPLKLADARAEARELLARVHLGEDPQRVRSAAAMTVKIILADYLSAAHLKPDTRKEFERLARVEILPALGDLPVAALSRADVRTWSDRIAKRAPYVANRAFGVLRRAYSWGAETDRLTGTPFVNLRKPSVERPSLRVLNTEELHALLLALDDLPGAYADVVWLLLYTGVRRDMVRELRRSELEGLKSADPRWIIPGGFEGRSKSGRTHVVPLSPQAIEVIGRRFKVVSGDLLFPGLNDETRAMWWQSKFARTLETTLNKHLGTETARWTIHNVRHTVGTHMREDLRVPNEVVSAILGHAAPGAPVSRVYNRAELLPERRTALRTWAIWLDRLKKSKSARPDLLVFQKKV